MPFGVYFESQTKVTGRGLWKGNTMDALQFFMLRYEPLHATITASASGSRYSALFGPLCGNAPIPVYS